MANKNLSCANACTHMHVDARQGYDSKQGVSLSLSLFLSSPHRKKEGMKVLSLPSFIQNRDKEGIVVQTRTIQQQALTTVAFIFVQYKETAKEERDSDSWLIKEKCQQDKTSRERERENRGGKEGSGERKNA
mmetsp:Transcript_45476/g.89575  ORF Transcript_45476/g.89575 Transcript_45476/m.89575 type:complete len:132 (-) Transcript_45476:236-631(-)